MHWQVWNSLFWKIVQKKEIKKLKQLDKYKVFFKPLYSPSSFFIKEPNCSVEECLLYTLSPGRWDREGRRAELFLIVLPVHDALVLKIDWSTHLSNLTSKGGCYNFNMSKVKLSMDVNNASWKLTLQRYFEVRNVCRLDQGTTIQTPFGWNNFIHCISLISF